MRPCNGGVLQVALLCLLVIFLFMSVPVTTLGGDREGDAKIVFLQLHMDRDGINLVTSTIVPGVLKQRRGSSKTGNMQYEVLNSAGEAVASDVLSNPLVKRFEYEDPDNPGQLRTKVIELEQTDFVVRFQYADNIDNISFYRLEPSKDPADKAAARTVMARVALSLSEGGDR
ncbi:MAG: hypothetical protein OEW00_05680 [candidate division Zixibacteria bacterium]|nr:hypothetical protein [candidate division Zixibacteria bacterium]